MTIHCQCQSMLMKKVGSEASNKVSTEASAKEVQRGIKLWKMSVSQNSKYAVKIFYSIIKFFCKHFFIFFQTHKLHT